jgi:hypothetical protein
MSAVFKGRSLIVAVLVTLGMGVGASSARALEWDYATSYGWVNFNGLCAYKVNPLVGKGCFEANGDWLEINDVAHDGYRTGVHWQTTGGRAGVCVTTHGFEPNSLQASWPYVSGGYLCNKDFPEGNSIRIRSGACDGSANNCEILSNWVQWSAWSDYLKVSQ